MVKTNINIVETWHKIPLDKLPDLLRSQGFRFVKSFSTDEHRIFVSIDNQYKIIIHKNIGKVYSTKNNKACIHTFAISAPSAPTAQQNDNI